jgi:hypothetical protein
MMFDVHNTPFKRMKAALQPSGTSPIVGIGFKDSPGCSNNAYYNVDFVHRCVDELERRVNAQLAGVDELTVLEQLAAQLLMASAYMTKEELSD